MFLHKLEVDLKSLCKHSDISHFQKLPTCWQNYMWTNIFTNMSSVQREHYRLCWFDRLSFCFYNHYFCVFWTNKTKLLGRNVCGACVWKALAHDPTPVFLVSVGFQCWLEPHLYGVCEWWILPGTAPHISGEVNRPLPEGLRYPEASLIPCKRRLLVLWSSHPRVTA